MEKKHEYCICAVCGKRVRVRYFSLDKAYPYKHGSMKNPCKGGYQEAKMETDEASHVAAAPETEQTELAEQMDTMTEADRHELAEQMNPLTAEDEAELAEQMDTMTEADRHELAEQMNPLTAEDERELAEQMDSTPPEEKVEPVVQKDHTKPPTKSFEFLDVIVAINNFGKAIREMLGVPSKEDLEEARQKALEEAVLKYISKERRAFTGIYSFVFDNILVDFDIDVQSFKITCILRDMPHGIPYAGVALLKFGEAWNFNIGSRVAIKRAAQAMAYGTTARKMKNLEQAMFMAPAVKYLSECIVSQYKRKLWLCTAPLDEVKEALCREFCGDPLAIERLSK